MFNSAEEVKRVLERARVASGDHRANDPLGAFLAEQFGLEANLVAHGEAFLAFLKLCDRMRQETIKIDTNSRHRGRVDAIVTELLECFIRLGAGMPLCQWGPNVPVSFEEKLDFVDLALSGSVGYNDVSKDARLVSQGVSSLIEETLATEMPSHLKLVMVARMRQLQAVLDHTRIWGVEGINEAVKALVGELVVVAAAGGVSKKDTNIIQALWKSVEKALSVGSSLSKGVEDGTKLSAFATSVIEKLT